MGREKHAKQQNNQLSLITVVMMVIVMKMDGGGYEGGDDDGDDVDGDDSGDDGANGDDDVMVMMVILMLYQGLICTGLHSRCFRYIASCPHYSLKRWSLSFLLCRGGSWGGERGMESLLGAGKSCL